MAGWGQVKFVHKCFLKIFRIGLFIDNWEVQMV